MLGAIGGAVAGAMGKSGGGGETATLGKYIMIAACVMLFFPMIINIFADINEDIEEVDETQETLLNDYYGIVNVDNTREQAWVLTGIYTPYGTGANGNSTNNYLILKDGWIAGERITTYTPSQYTTGLQDEMSKEYVESYTVKYDSQYGMYYYSGSASGGYNDGDLYTRVTMDKAHMSSVFFSSSGKVTDGSNFYYQFNGWRYVFQPTSNYDGATSTGESRTIVADTSSLSLIWYYYLTTSGIAGQLIISGTDEGVSYLTANEIVKGFDKDNYTAKFTMEFNGVDMNVYILINPTAIQQGYTVEECYNNGYWSMLVTSLSADADSTTNTDYSFNIYEIWNTIKALFTFNASDYFQGDETTSFIASLVFSGTFYIILIAIGLNHHMVLIMAAVLAVFQTLSKYMSPVVDAVTGIAEGIADLGEKIWNALTGVAEAVMGTFTGMADAAGDLFDWWPLW